MKERIFTGWTIRRGIYLVMGVLVIIQSLMSHEWFGVIFGGYFASMGLFAFGCAGDNCSVRSFTKEHQQRIADKIQPIDFEEVK